MGSLAIARLTVEHLTLPRQLLAVENLHVERGELCAVIGPNLSGRTALLRALSGELQHSSQYRIDLQASWSDAGNDPPVLLDPAADVVYLGPTPENLISALTETVRGEIELHQACAWPTAPDSQFPGISEAVEALGLAELLDRNPVELSGGQMASVALTTALALRRPLVCIDGLLAQLDVQKRSSAYRLLAAYAATGAVVLIAENDLDWAPVHARRVVLLNDGRCELAGPAREVLRAERLSKLGCAPTAARYARELKPTLSSGSLPLTAHEFVTWLRQEYGLA
jgi:ABC-type Mn2+/Zn2+ transport system ATPase subunit